MLNASEAFTGFKYSAYWMTFALQALKLDFSVEAQGQVNIR